jgi:hypothetical protein
VESKNAAQDAATSRRRVRWRHYVAGLAAIGATVGVAIVAVPWAGAAGAPGSGCAAVNVITARASTEQPGEGSTGTVAQAIQSGSKQTVSRESVSYPATLTNYNTSESQGVTNAEQELTTAVRNCPDQKQVLLGYSQGAQVVTDVIAGSAELLGGPHVAPVSTSVSSHVVAIAQFGDPGHVVNQPWDLGSATQNGLFRRTSAQLRLLNTFGGSSKVHGWCDSGDPFCASGTNVEVHLAYVQRDQNAATSFVLGSIGG